MSAPHFLVLALEHDQITLSLDDSHHALRALRMTLGEAITVTDGRGAFAQGVVASIDAAGLQVRIASVERLPRPSPSVTVAFGLTKGAKPEEVVEDLTELGVDRIIPFEAARSIVRWDDAKRRAHGDRMRAVAVSALKQSRRAFLPDVADPAPSLVASLGTAGTRLVLHETATDPFPAALAEDVVIAIGPEGGFDDTELTAARSAGAHIVGLGRGVLRAQTAAVVAATLVLDRLGRLS